MKPGCTLIATMVAKPEKRAELLNILMTMVAPTRAESACIGYHLHVSDADQNKFVFYENWNSREELNQHLDMPHLKPLVERMDELLDGQLDLQFLTMVSAM